MSPSTVFYKEICPPAPRRPRERIQGPFINTVRTPQCKHCLGNEFNEQITFPSFPKNELGVSKQAKMMLRGPLRLSPIENSSVRILICFILINPLVKNGQGMAKRRPKPGHGPGPRAEQKESKVFCFALSLCKSSVLRRVRAKLLTTCSTPPPEELHGLLPLKVIKQKIIA